MRELATKASIVGNLALAPSWDRLSDTEPEPLHDVIFIAHPSTQVSTGTCTSSVWNRMRHQSEFFTARAHQLPQLDLFATNAADVVITTPRGEVIRVEAKHIREYQKAAEPWCDTPLLAASASKLRSMGVSIGSLVFASYASNVEIEDAVFMSASSSPASYTMLIHDKVLQSEDRLKAFKTQISKLHDELVQWPGSYNQLLLAGSLDYCRSAISKLRTSHADVREEVSKAIRSYYSLCLGICEQYREAKTTLRRLNLQLAQDRFDLLQETCAKYGVYPRLEELDVADIPSD